MILQRYLKTHLKHCNLYHNFVNYEYSRTEYIQYFRSFFEFEDAIEFQ